MAQLAPLTIRARNRDQAEYLVRSRAEQRGVKLTDMQVVPAGDGVWSVTVTVDDAARSAALLLGEDTQVLQLHPPTD